MWRRGRVEDILENSKYIVDILGNEEIEVDQWNLRVHRDWDDGSWVPPLFEQNKLPETKVKPGNVKLKIIFGKRISEAKFKEGAIVEVSSDEEGFKGAWYSAIVVKHIGDDKFLVEYLTLKTEDESMPLREEAKAQYIRPFPPQPSPVASFEHLQQDDKPSVLEVKSKAMKLKTKVNEEKSRPEFNEGMKVQVRSDEVGYEGSWYAASIVKRMRNEKYLVEYLTLKTDDQSKFLREEADALDIRPFSPSIHRAYPYSQFEYVDAWYNHGWRAGQICKVFTGWKYSVYFKTTREELEFDHTDLSPHQVWFGGKWLPVSSDWKP